MRVLICPDSFGATATAAGVATALASGWRGAAPDDEITVLPLSDGGPGFADTLAAARPDARRIGVACTDPLGRPARGTVVIEDGRAYVETAHATGLHHLAPAERDPERTTSYGVGALVRGAVEAGVREVVLGLGGSATNDGGAGLLAALGVVAVDAAGRPLPPGGAALVRCAAVRLEPMAPVLPRPLDPADPQAGAHPAVVLVAATDVDAPLTGPAGASAVFGPQKGATAEQVARLDAALARFAAVLVRDVPGCPADLAVRPGSGAAGGLGAAVLALGGRRESGFAVVASAVGLDEVIGRCDLVLTGEGTVDAQTLRGKVVAGVAAVARERGVACVVVAGQVRLRPDQLRAAGVHAAVSLVDEVGSVEEAMRRPERGLRAIGARLAREFHDRDVA